jgi:hypothetical protein
MYEYTDDKQYLIKKFKLYLKREIMLYDKIFSTFGLSYPADTVSKHRFYLIMKV